MLLAPLLPLLLLAQDVATFRSEVRYIRVDAQVLKGNQPVIDLTRDDFRILDEGVPQSITNFASENVPLDIILLLDVSSSTTPIEQEIKDSACAALKLLGPDDRVGVVSFFSSPRLVLEPSSDKAAIEAAIRGIDWDHAGTELNNSSLRAASYLAVRSRPNARRAVIILTDNVGYGAIPSYRVLDGLWTWNVVYNALLFGKMTGAADVREFANATGGEVIHFEGREIPFEPMFRRLRERYVMMYRAPEGYPGESRQIKVELSAQGKQKQPGAKVHARTGYRVPKSSAE